MSSPLGRTAVFLVALAASLLTLGSLQQAPPAEGFAPEIARLSEPEGSFDTDNLISNEGNYLDVVPALVSGGVTGGTYIGVGPDQNFSYIARIRPTLAYIIDIRRDNLLLHLLFKALFARSATRVEYLSLLTGRAPPPDLERWKNATIREITAYVDEETAPPSDRLRRSLRASLEEFDVPLTTADLDTINRFQLTFIEQGLDLRFQTFGRPPRPGYPTLRELLLAADANGQAWNYLAREDDFQFVKALQARNGIIPVVGDVAGTRSMRAIAEAIAARGSRVSAFYVSNVETYLRREGNAARFTENVSMLPHDSRSVMIRSLFGRDGSSASVVVPFPGSRAF